MKDSSKLLNKYVEKHESIVSKDKEANMLFESIKNGQRTYSRIIRTEDTANSLKWIDVVEEYIPSIQKIIDNPKRFIKSVNYLVKAELAKRTGPETVVHLASHSQYVKKFDEYGNVIPSKVLTSEAEDDLAIYENRFVMTLIKKLYIFVERRYKFLKDFSELKNSNILYVDNKFKFGDMEVVQTSCITIKTPSSNKADFDVEKVLKRVDFIKKYTTSFMNSQFMKELRSSKPVTPPIMQTNMLRKNPEYRNCYKLWLFLGEDERESLDFLVTEDIKNLDEEEVNKLDMLSYLYTLDALQSTSLKTLRFTSKKYACKVLKSIDDKLFLNEKFKDFELVRTDEKYYDDLIEAKKAKIVKDVSSKVQKKVNKKEIEDIKKLEKQKKAALALAKRKEKEAKQLEIKLEKERQEELRKEALRQEEERRRQEKERIEQLARLRKEIVETANKDKEDILDEESKQD